MMEGLHRIVVVGGGAGGLELATRLGNKLGRRGKDAVHTRFTAEVMARQTLAVFQKYTG